MSWGAELHSGGSVRMKHIIDRTERAEDPPRCSQFSQIKFSQGQGLHIFACLVPETE